MKFYFILFIFILFFVRCDGLDEKLKIVNKSEEELYYLLKTDTILSEDLRLSPFRNFDTIKVGIVGGEGAWEYRINNKSKDSTLYVFIFSDKKITSDLIFNREYIVKGFKVKDLNEHSWILTYPDDF